LFVSALALGSFRILFLLGLTLVFAGIAGCSRRQPVTPGPERAGKTEILSGLSSGQRVVVEGGLLLQSVLASSSSRS